MSHKPYRFLIVALLLGGLAGAAERLEIRIGGDDPLVFHEPNPVIRGAASAPAGTIVELRIGESAATALVDENGRWGARWPEPLPLGTWEVIATIRQGGSIAEDWRTIRIETEGTLPRRPLVDRPSTEELIEPVRPNSEEFLPYTDRWMIVPPPGYDLIVPSKGPLDPYNQNILKGDRPIWGERVFLSLTGISDTILESRNVPTPSGVSAEDPGSIDFFGEGDQIFLNQNVVVSADLYKGLTTFRPADWRVRATVFANFSHVDIAERGGVNPDVRRGSDRSDGQLSLQELFYERKLADLSTDYDFVSVRAGIQPFNSDFRGFIFNDTNLGLRLFGSLDENRYQYNLAFFERLEKDTNSGLNIISELRDQRVVIANAYQQDFLVPGHTFSVSAHYMKDDASLFYDQNDFLVRPDPIGDFTPHDIEATWLGLASFGKAGIINIDGAAYYVFGRDSHNPIAGADAIGGGLGEDGVEPGRAAVDISAYMVALELSIDRDWYRPKIGFFITSGDDDITDRDANGFAAIFSNPNFAGGGFSFWNRLGIRLPPTGVGLVHRGSLIPDLSSSKEEGQPNFVNPGLQLGTIGLDLEVSPKIKTIFTLNYLRLAETNVIRGVLFQDTLSNELGFDLSAGVKWRPYLNNNVTFVGGAALFVPGQGFEDIYLDDSVLYQIFTNLILTF